MSQEVRSDCQLLNIRTEADGRRTVQRSLARTNSSRKAFVACTANIPFSAAF
jgi:hypothetical protein